MVAINDRKLRAKMAEHGYNITTLSEKLDVDRNTIGNVLNHKTNPSYPIMNGLYYALELTPQEGEEIFFGTNLHETQEK